MAKVTSKLQVTVPKVIADRYRISPGDEVEFVPAGEMIRLVPRERRQRPISLKQRLQLFDEATARQAGRDGERHGAPKGADRGWTRAEVYDRGRAR